MADCARSLDVLNVFELDSLLGPHFVAMKNGLFAIDPRVERFPGRSDVHLVGSGLLISCD